MIIIKKIKWIDKEALEAEVLLSDNNYCILCFSSPCTLSENSIFEDIIYGFNVENIFKLSQEEYAVEKDDKSYSHKLKGKFVDDRNSILQIEEFRIDLSDGEIPKDIIAGDFIEVSVSRIDIY
ncbi:hypothetical protein [Listeria welshimeri]|uniref:hypothetical protein n=1 Tax=Listeria welshimeri TaxID=1643 RepID=UPI0018887D1F|nr:hypothetical protein [Listeria welshimeri]MBF2353136.1 hypothetical protein [Listeria welshimeri]